MDDSPEHGQLVSLDADDCMALLGAHCTGRLVLSGPIPYVRPVNYVLAEDQIILQMAEPIDAGVPVAFEVDQIDEIGQRGWSVIVEGRASSVPFDDVATEIREQLAPWAPGPKPWLTAIVIDAVSGRWIRAARTWHGTDDRGYI